MLCHYPGISICKNLRIFKYAFIGNLTSQLFCDVANSVERWNDTRVIKDAVLGRQQLWLSYTTILAFSWIYSGKSHQH
jgi:hypothetical protein